MAQVGGHDTGRREHAHHAVFAEHVQRGDELGVHAGRVREQAHAATAVPVRADPDMVRPHDLQRMQHMRHEIVEGRPVGLRVEPVDLLPPGQQFGTLLGRYRPTLAQRRAARWLDNLDALIPEL